MTPLPKTALVAGRSGRESAKGREVESLHPLRGQGWLARKDSNLRSPDPESGALPLGHSPMPERSPNPRPATFRDETAAHPKHSQKPIPRTGMSLLPA
jgi:hypothetical protein